MDLGFELHDCDMTTCTKENITDFFEQLCYINEMDRGPLEFWDTTKGGFSAVQLVDKGDITMYMYKHEGWMYINMVHEDDFDPLMIKTYAANWFNGMVGRP